MLIMPFLAFFSVQAATTATDAYDIPTTIKTSEAANHDIYITTSVAIPESDTLTLTFDADFTLTGLTEDDIDVLDDATDLTTAANCAAADEASVGIAGQVITITICAGDGGAIAAGSVMRIKIGSNAVASGTGSNQITNPANAGTYYIDAASGTNDLMASIPIPIIADDDSNVSATTPAPPSTGTSGPGPDPFDPDDTITIVSPDGDDVFNDGDTVNISWNSTGTIPYVHLKYSIDGGGNYSIIEEQVNNTGSYSWTAPEVTTDEALIKIEGTDLATILATDTSDSFEIIGPIDPFVTVISPNGSEEYEVGETISILWDSSGTYDAARIEISENGGNDFDVIANTTSDDGSYTYKIGIDATNQALIRVTGLFNNRGVYEELESDTSDNGFTVIEPDPSSVTVLYPNGGEEWIAGNTHSVLWDSSDDIETVNITAIHESGAFRRLATDIPNTGIFTFTWPEGRTVDAMRMRINGFRSDGESFADMSDASFSVVEAEDALQEIRVISPNGGEFYRQNDNITISWEGSGFLDAVDIYYSADGGQSSSPVIIGATGANFDWTAPAIISDTVLVYINGVFRGEVLSNDISDGFFSIAEPLEEEIEEDEEEIGEDEEEDVEEEELTEEDEEGDQGDDVSEGEIALSVFAGNGQIQLTERGGEVLVLSNSSVALQTNTANANSVRYVIDGRSIDAASITDNAFSANIAISNSPIAVTIIADFDDESSVSETLLLNPVSRGLISTEGSPLSDAVIFVFANDSQWPAGVYGQSNPVITGAGGGIGWYVPNGLYRVTAAHDQYIDVEITVRVSNNILIPSLNLLSIEEEGILDQITEILPGPISDIVVSIGGTINEFRESPAAQVSADISKPIIVASVATSAAVLVTSFNFLPFLQYLYTFPVMFFARRRRENFGVVYHSITKVPISLAVVRLISEQGRLIKSIVTDELGRYFLKASPGRYRIEVRKDDLKFPSEYLRGKKSDGGFLDIYTDGFIEVTEADITIAANIPLDPSDLSAMHAPRRILFKRFLRIFQLVAAPAGLLLAFYVLIIQPSVLTLGGVLIQLSMFGATHVLIQPKKRRGWGIVREYGTNVPITNAIVRLFEPKFNKLIETQITDAKGRYAFLAGSNEYYMTVDKDGYRKKEIRPIDYTEKTEPSPISIDVDLEKGV